MNVGELIYLAKWLKGTVPKAISVYKPFLGKLQNNMQNSPKQPLEEEVYNLRQYLSDQTLQELSNEQLDLLHAFDVLNYFGHHGMSFVDDIVSSEDFDPATAHQQVTEAVQALNQSLERANKILEALDVVETPDLEVEPGRVLVRVRFDGKAAINNVVDLKNWAASWHDIARGIAMAVDESPGNVRILGASRGSLIFVLSTSLAVTTLLGTIIKIVTNRARDMVLLASDIEDLRHKKVLNSEIEDAMNKRIEEIRKDAPDEVTEEIQEKLGSNTDTAALNKSIRTLLDFIKQGGDLDFVSPPRLEEQPATSDSENEDDTDVEEAAKVHQRLIAQTDEVRELIEEIREHKESVKLLSDLSGDDEPDDE